MGQMSVTAVRKQQKTLVVILLGLALGAFSFILSFSSRIKNLDNDIENGTKAW
jgi:hypothetical protein